MRRLQRQVPPLSQLTAKEPLERGVMLNSELVASRVGTTRGAVIMSAHAMVTTTLPSALRLAKCSMASPPLSSEKRSET
jgi:hypothetical protein